MGDVQPFRWRQRQATPGPDPSSATGVVADETTLGPEALLAAAGLGDEAAFAELYDHLAPLIYGITLKVIRNPAQAEEVAQEVFVEIWRLAPRYDLRRGALKSWAATIAHRRAVDRVRAEQAARNREESEHAKALPPVDSIVEAVDDELQHRRVRAALDVLTDVQRSAIELAYYGGHTYREVAVLLDIAEGTAKTRIRDGLIRLRDHLGVTS